MIRTIDVVLNVLSGKQCTSHICEDFRYLTPQKSFKLVHLIVLYEGMGDAIACWQGGIFGIRAIFLSELSAGMPGSHL